MGKFNEVLDWLRDIGLDFSLLLAGIFGSLLRVSQEKEQISNGRKFLLLFSGGGTSAYIAPLFIDLLNIGDNTQYGIAFIIGVMGMNAVDLIVGKIKGKMNETK
jgi:hypothetical protein